MAQASRPTPEKITISEEESFLNQVFLHNPPHSIVKLPSLFLVGLCFILFEKQNEYLKLCNLYKNLLYMCQMEINISIVLPYLKGYFSPLPFLIESTTDSRKYHGDTRSLIITCQSISLNFSLELYSFLVEDEHD